MSRNIQKDETPTVDKLAAELFGMLQTPQGYFHFSDGETFASRAAFFERVRGRLKWGKEAVRLTGAFLKKYGELRPRP